MQGWQNVDSESGCIKPGMTEEFVAYLPGH